MLHKGGPRKADLLVVDLGQGEMVVKDFGSKSAWTRFLGRVQIRREIRAYEWLRGVEGVPALIGRVDAHAFAMERIRGEMLAFSAEKAKRGRELLSKVRGLIDRLHSTGLVHLDLRGRENILLRTDGELSVVDLAGAVRFRPGSVRHRLFFRLFALTDESAYLKWKEMLAPGTLTPDDERMLRKQRILRSLWIFNPKRRPK